MTQIACTNAAQEIIDEIVARLVVDPDEWQVVIDLDGCWSEVPGFVFIDHAHYGYDEWGRDEVELMDQYWVLSGMKADRKMIFERCLFKV